MTVVEFVTNESHSLDNGANWHDTQDAGGCGGCFDQHRGQAGTQHRGTHMYLTEQQKKVIASIYAAGYERGIQDLDNELDYDPAARALEFLAEVDSDGGLDKLFEELPPTMPELSEAG